jgi:hypothetical protein
MSLVSQVCAFSTEGHKNEMSKHPTKKIITNFLVLRA